MPHLNTHTTVPNPYLLKDLTMIRTFEIILSSPTLLLVCRSLVSFVAATLIQSATIHFPHFKRYKSYIKIFSYFSASNKQTNTCPSSYSYNSAANICPHSVAHNLVTHFVSFSLPVSFFLSIALSFSFSFHLIYSTMSVDWARYHWSKVVSDALILVLL